MPEHGNFRRAARARNCSRSPPMSATAHRSNPSSGLRTNMHGTAAVDSEFLDIPQVAYVVRTSVSLPPDA